MVELGLADGMVSGATHTTARHDPPELRADQDAARRLDRVERVPDVPDRPRARLRRLRGQPEPDRRAARGHRDLVGGDRGALRHRAARGDAVVLDRRVRHRRRGRAGPRGDRARAPARPELSVEGPIQYDAAVDASVAATKLPASTVAGHATVFIFPDLNTGNNTYKAVQRSAGAVAIGPVLQGLAQAGERPLARRDRRRHRQHGRDHGDPGAGGGGRLSVLVLNCGSSSLKYRLVDVDRQAALTSGLVERIGQPGSVPDHEAAVAEMLDALPPNGIDARGAPRGARRRALLRARR